MTTYDTRGDKLTEKVDEQVETKREKFKGQAIPLLSNSSSRYSSGCDFECPEGSCKESSNTDDIEGNKYIELKMVENWIKDEK
mmetsp:Transcript_39876/g.45752  ORF Transcript_39876/g.45752 Transcript_39876/m.45752 type:complete len:83 (+) Transcript_39876:494-742(+)